MDPIQNPFSPGAGSRPPELVGRDEILSQAEILLGRVKEGRSGKSIILTGLRGVGKTVLLNAIARGAQEAAYRTIMIEAHEDKTLAGLLAPHFRTVLFDLDRIANAGDKAKKGLAVLKSFLNGVRISIGELDISIEAETGTADSGDLESDLPNVFLAIAEAAKERNKVIVLLIDELQYINQKELSALIMAMHRIQQRQLPLVLIGAGLPILPGMAGESKSYAERLFNFPIIGPVSEEDSNKALQEPAKEKGVSFEENALKKIYEFTKGYPYFIQEWGYQSWNLATSSPISIHIIEEATHETIRSLDQNFFRVRFDRLTPAEKHCLRAMAGLGSGIHRSAEIAEALNIKINSLGPVRATLIKKGMIYSPNHGEMAFTVPLFDEFMVRAMPSLQEI